MWMLLATAAAGDLGRQTEELKITRYARLDGDGPVTGRWRNRTGAHVAWHFPDGQIEHVETFDGKTLQTTRTFAADGRPEATVDWAAATVTVHLAPPVQVPLSGWAPFAVGSLSLQAPPDLVAGAEGTWAGTGLSVARQAAADPFAPAFAAEVAEGCGCAVEARRTVWIAGHPALQLRLARPALTADLVALPLGDALWVFSTAGPEIADLAPLRAMMATAREATP